MVNNLQVSFILLGVVLYTGLIMTSIFLLVKTIKNDSFKFVRNQSILCALFSATTAASYLLALYWVLKGIEDAGVYLALLDTVFGTISTFSAILIFWNISL